MKGAGQPPPTLRELWERRPVGMQRLPVRSLTEMRGWLVSVLLKEGPCHPNLFCINHNKYPSKSEKLQAVFYQHVLCRKINIGL